MLIWRSALCFTCTFHSPLPRWERVERNRLRERRGKRHEPQHTHTHMWISIDTHTTYIDARTHTHKNTQAHTPSRIKNSKNTINVYGRDMHTLTILWGLFYCLVILVTIRQCSDHLIFSDLSFRLLFPTLLSLSTFFLISILLSFPLLYFHIHSLLSSSLLYFLFSLFISILSFSQIFRALPTANDLLQVTYSILLYSRVPPDLIES